MRTAQIEFLTYEKKYTCMNENSLMTVVGDVNVERNHGLGTINYKSQIITNTINIFVELMIKLDCLE